MKEEPLPELPTEFGTPVPEWMRDLYGPTGEGDPLDPWWVDKKSESL